jgi:hypothetical protein
MEERTFPLLKAVRVLAWNQTDATLCGMFRVNVVVSPAGASDYPCFPIHKSIREALKSGKTSANLSIGCIEFDIT